MILHTLAGRPPLILVWNCTAAASSKNMFCNSGTPIKPFKDTADRQLVIDVWGNEVKCTYQIPIWMRFTSARGFIFSSLLDSVALGRTGFRRLPNLEEFRIKRKAWYAPDFNREYWKAGKNRYEVICDGLITLTICNMENVDQWA
jgi:hypothetical protein